jgi:hypothetical protein
MSFRLAMVVGAAAYLVVITSCGTGGSNPVTTISPVARTTSLPLQSKGLAVGRDVESRAKDVVARGITEAQAKKIADACNRTVEVTSDNEACAKAVSTALAAPNPLPCQPGDKLLCLQVWDVSNVSGLDQQAVIDIRDDRPGESLCNSEPDDVCLRVGVPTSSILNQIAKRILFTTPSGEVPSGEVPSSTTPSTATPIPTSSSSPMPTSSSSPPGGTTTPAGSP